MWPRALVKAAKNRSPLRLALVNKWVLHKEATWNAKATAWPGFLGIWKFQQKHDLPSLGLASLISASWSPLSLTHSSLHASGPTWVPAIGPESTCPTVPEPLPHCQQCVIPLIQSPAGTTRPLGTPSTPGVGHEAHPACPYTGSGGPSTLYFSHQLIAESK